jgi:hypothetical protein
VLHHAVVVWGEEKITLDPEGFTQPSFLVGRKLNPFDGLFPGSQHGFAPLHGWGLCSFIKYLQNTTNWDPAGLQATYTRLHQSLPAHEALLANLTGPPAAAWVDYLREYVGGNLYAVHPDTFMTEASQAATSWTISTSDDTVKVFDSAAVRSYADMSGRMFAIRLNYPTMDEATQVQFQASSDDVADGLYSVIVFGYKPGQSLLYIGQAAELRIADIRAMQDEGYTHLLGVVANGRSVFTPNETSDIYLVVKVIAPDPITECYVWARVKCNYELQYPPDPPTEGEAYFDIGAYQKPGTWTDTNTFSVIWNELDPETGNADEIRVTVLLDQTRDNILRLDVYRHLNHSNPVNRDLVEVLTAFNIPRFTNYYRVDGLETMNHFTEFKSTEVGDQHRYEAKLPISDEENFIVVKFF